MKLPPLPSGVRAGRLPGWSPANARRRPCPICGADDPHPLVERPDGFTVHACACGMTYLAEVPAPFDIVCAFHVLEHLPAPDDLIAAASSPLSADGRFLVAVPNGGEVERSGPFWVGFRVDLEHLNYFGPKTLASLLARHGLWVEQVWERDQPDLQRPRPAAPSGLKRRLVARLRGRTGPAAFRAGDFSLTVLERQV